MSNYPFSSIKLLGPLKRLRFTYVNNISLINIVMDGKTNLENSIILINSNGWKDQLDKKFQV